jgi:hypothetical protein
LATLLKEILLKDYMAHDEDAFKAVIIVFEDDDSSKAKPGTHNRVQQFKNVFSAEIETTAQQEKDKVSPVQELEEQAREMSDVVEAKLRSDGLL